MVINKCLDCGKEIGRSSLRCIPCSKKGNDFGKYNKGKIRLDFRGEGNPRWNGGKCILKTGYLEVISGRNNSVNTRGRILEHRKVMEDYLGRKLLITEHIHHINGNKTDNRIENLELTDNINHKNKHKPTQITKNKISVANKGRVFSKEHRINLSKSAMGNTNGKRR